MSNPFDPHDAECRALAQNDVMRKRAGGELCPYYDSPRRLAFFAGWHNEPSHRQKEWHRGRMARLIYDEGQT